MVRITMTQTFFEFGLAIYYRRVGLTLFGKSRAGDHNLVGMRVRVNRQREAAHPHRIAASVLFNGGGPMGGDCILTR